MLHMSNDKPLITFHVETAVIKMIKRLVREGRYATVSEFVNKALEEFLEKWRETKDAFPDPGGAPRVDVRNEALDKRIREMLVRYVATYALNSARNGYSIVRVASVVRLLCSGGRPRRASALIGYVISKILKGERWRPGVYVVKTEIAREKAGSYDLDLLTAAICQ